MKEVACTARNIMVIPVSDGEKLSIRPMIETILVFTEPNYRINKENEVVVRREPQTIRFSASPESLREIAKNFLEWAEQAEDFARCLGLEKEQPKPNEAGPVAERQPG